MSTLLEKMLAEDRVWDTLSSSIIGKTRKTSRGFIRFNCPVCTYSQSRADTKMRCYLKYDNEGIGINCFNCRTKLRYKKGGLLSQGMEQFLSALGVPDQKVKELFFWAWQIKSALKDASPAEQEACSTFHIGFPSMELPKGARPLTELADEGCEDEDFIDVVEYLYSRGEELADSTSFYWTPTTKNNLNRRLIIPFYYDGRIVGWSGRHIDDVAPKYWNQSPPGYIFNCDIMNLTNRKYLLITEGLLDALSIDCLGLQGNELNEKQLSWINESKQTKIVVPDRDSAGDRLIDMAVLHGWHVAFPRGSGFGKSEVWWDQSIKDSAEATKTYGRLWTLRSIIATATSNKTTISINRAKKHYTKRQVYGEE
jgi:hypothetical protein